jgi:predicted peptidase
MTTKTFLADTAVGKIPMILYTPSVKKLDVCIVFFHGRDEDGNGELDGLSKLLNNTNHKNLIDKAEQYGFTVLAPQVSAKLTGVRWWTAQFIEAIITYALKNHTMAPKIAVTGLSQGGGTIWQALTNPKTADKIFAAIAICPTAQYEGDFSLIAKNKIAVWDFHAKDDGVVGVASSRNMVAKANSFDPSPRVKYDELTAGNHYIWGAIYNRNDVYDYILDYIPAGATQPIPPIDPLPDEVLYTIKTTVYKSGKIESVKL